MRIQPTTYVDISTEFGPMRTHLFRPLANAKQANALKFPAVILYSEIYSNDLPDCTHRSNAGWAGFSCSRARDLP